VLRWSAKFWTCYGWRKSSIGPVAEDLVLVLAKFHGEVLLPDVMRVVAEAVEASERRLRDELHKLFDSLAGELKDLRETYTMLSHAVARIEERLERIEQRVEKMALRSELLELKARVEGLQAQVQALEERLAD
jgi:chromosome segregation ATPase